MAVEKNFAFYVGEDKEIRDLICQDGEEADLSSWHVGFTLKNSAGTVVLSKDSGAGTVTLTSPYAIVPLNRADTRDLPPGDYDYEITRTDTGDNQVLTIGKITLKKRVYGG